MQDGPAEAAERRYRLRHWGEGHFAAGADGRLRVLPDRAGGNQAIVLQDVVDELRAQGMPFPVVVRFHDVLRSRVRELNEAFGEAIAEAGYEAPYRGVYPIKVNQMREVVDEIVDAGRPYGYGLEAGSKTELLAVLSYDLADDALVVCNGYKDEDFLRLALLGCRLRRNVVVVVEKFSELEPLLRLAAEMQVRPGIGVRIKMRVQTEGRWSGSSGEKAKFGLTISEILNAVALVEARGYADSLCLLHFHVGSQLSDVRFVQDAVQEAARIYARLYKRGVPLRYLDIGGGLAVDYDGTRSSGESSMNYTMQEYASSVVYNVRQVCELERVPHPVLVSESGRAVTAHHSCVVIQVLGEIANDANPVATDPVEGEHVLVANMRELNDELAQYRNFRDAYNQASRIMSDVQEAFRLGVLRLEELARAETLYWCLMRAIAEGVRSKQPVPGELRDVESLIGSQYLCNFSLFQSAADAWAIGQVLPVVPLTRLDEEPTRNCTLVDITCDSDGKLTRFVGEDGTSDTVPLHALVPGESYYVGLFLTGAYQDVMGDMHNLFGRLNEAHVYADADDPSGFYIEEAVAGSSAEQVLATMQYNPSAMAARVKAAIDAEVGRGHIRPRDGVKLVDFYESCLRGYTYLGGAT